MKKQLTYEQLYEIASKKGYTEFLGNGEGFETPALFTNGLEIVVINIITGDIMHKYSAKSRRVSHQFLDPAEHIKACPRDGPNPNQREV